MTKKTTGKIESKNLVKKARASEVRERRIEIDW